MPSVSSVLAAVGVRPPPETVARVKRVRRQLPGRRARWGSLARAAPLSSRWGLERGLPADRALIARFLQQHRADVRGRVMEVQEDRYAGWLADGQVTSTEIVDHDADNPGATRVADLDQPGSLPREEYDAIVLTQVLQYLRPHQSLPNLYAALRPGGTLLLTTPGIAPLDWRIPELDLWRATPAGVRELLAGCCPGAELQVVGLGNVAYAVAVLHGLAADEVPARLREVDDPAFPVIVGARVRRPL